MSYTNTGFIVARQPQTHKFCICSDFRCQPHREDDASLPVTLYATNERLVKSLLQSLLKISGMRWFGWPFIYTKRANLGAEPETQDLKPGQHGQILLAFFDTPGYTEGKKTNMVRFLKYGGADMQVNILEAKTNLSNLVRMVETGEEETVIIARYGKPVVKMTVYQDKPVSGRIGVAKGKLRTPADLDRDNAEIEALFGGGL